ncbi:unnamed protein product [Rotaria socialis]|uniref:N-acetyltransferase domain-containing protein n=1 Tax=Rotaria socialis TaxID=392032 RepID=A0A818WTU8_9BILA|nr:unnamed protein product [Rotaria socialis]
MSSDTIQRILPINGAFLRLMQPDQLEKLYELLELNRDYLREHIPGIDLIRTREDLQKRWITKKKNSLQFGLWLDELLVGRCRLTRDENSSSADIGYWLSKYHQGHGLMTASVKDLVQFAFEVWNVRRVEIHCGANNLKSRAIPERLGFINEGILPNDPVIPLRGCSADIHPNARWKQNGLTVAGGNEQGNGINQLSNPSGLHVDDDQTVYIADPPNHRIVEWKSGATSGQVVASGNEEGSGTHQLSRPPQYVFVYRDHSVYVSDWGNHRVMKWMEGAKEGTTVAGGQGKGNGLTQLSSSEGVVIGQLDTVYVADYWNARIMCWLNGATQGSVIVGGNGAGEQSNELSGPEGLLFDRHGNFYVVDYGNHRVQKFNIGFNG